MLYLTSRSDHYLEAHRALRKFIKLQGYSYYNMEKNANDQVEDQEIEPTVEHLQKGDGAPKTNKHGVILVPQPSDDPRDPLVR